MLVISTFLKYLIGSLTLAAIAYYLLAILAAAKFFLESQETQRGPLHPVTIMIPLCGADFGAYESYASFCRQDYPQYQVVFGVRDSLDPSIPVVRKLMADFPDRDIELVICPKIIGTNLKVSNLHNMVAQVKHEHIVIVDSDIQVGEDYLRSIMASFENERVGLVTCLYRATKVQDWASRLEAIGISAEFAAGVLMARLVEGVKFALGATMATTKSRLQAIGGFEAVADYLADDFMLGNLISKAGYEVRLSHYVVATVLAPVGFWPMVKHQIRWARGTRVCRPLGYLGLIFTYGTALALLGVLASRASGASLVLLGFTLAVRLTMGWLIGVHWIGDSVLKRYFWLFPVRDLMSFMIWGIGLVGKKVEWRGKLFQLVEDGKLVSVSDPALEWRCRRG